VTGLHYGYGPAGRGGLDLNVRPRKAEVYVDGQRLGRAGDFDGFPGYLWLEKGTHELALYKDGYLTVVQEFTIRPGLIQEVKFRLAPGKSVPLDEFGAQLGVDGNR
ncbi:MAG: PEGA domain-containing protein, partial [Thermoanaerobaculia bacterium]